MSAGRIERFQCPKTGSKGAGVFNQPLASQVLPSAKITSQQMFLALPSPSQTRKTNSFTF